MQQKGKEVGWPANTEGRLHLHWLHYPRLVRLHRHCLRGGRFSALISFWRDPPPLRDVVDDNLDQDTQRRHDAVEGKQRLHEGGTEVDNG